NQASQSETKDPSGRFQEDRGRPSAQITHSAAGSLLIGVLMNHFASKDFSDADTDFESDYEDKFKQRVQQQLSMQYESCVVQTVECSVVSFPPPHTAFLPFFGEHHK
ncbi:unnamed protein product, partial [Sphacelaria rigidula]